MVRHATPCGSGLKRSMVRPRSSVAFFFLRGQPSVPGIIKRVKPSFVLLSANFATVPCVPKNHKSNNSQNPGGTK